MVRALASVAKEESASGVREFRVPEKDSLTALAESSSGDIRYRFSIKKVCMHCRDGTGRGNQPHQMILPSGNLFSERQSMRFSLPA